MNYKSPVIGNKQSKIKSQRDKMTYRVNTSSLQGTGIVPIQGAKLPYPDEPQVHFTREAWVKQCHLVDRCSKEVGWFALVDHYDDTNVFVVHEIIIPKQQVSEAETNIGKNDLADAAMELIELGKDTSKMIAWFHSHVNMSVTPSGQDEYQVEDFLEDLAGQPEIPAFIRGIQNKKGDLKIDVYYINYGIAYQNVDHFIQYDDDPQWTKDIDAEIKTKVTDQPAYSYVPKVPVNGGPMLANSFYDDYYGRGYNDRVRQDAYYDDDGFDHTPLEQAVQQHVENADVPPADLKPKTGIMHSTAWWNMDTVYETTDGLEVLEDVTGELYICTPDGELYDYNEYTEACGVLSK